MLLLKKIYYFTLFCLTLSKKQPRSPEAALDLIIPEDTHVYRNNLEKGCAVVCEDQMYFMEITVYHEWATLTQVLCDGSPQKTSERSKVNKKEVRRRLKEEKEHNRKVREDSSKKDDPVG